MSRAIISIDAVQWACSANVIASPNTFESRRADAAAPYHEPWARNSLIVSRWSTEDITSSLKFRHESVNRGFVVTCSLCGHGEPPKTLKSLFSIMERPSNRPSNVPCTLLQEARSIYPREAEAEGAGCVILDVLENKLCVNTFEK